MVKLYVYDTEYISSLITGHYVNSKRSLLWLEETVHVAM